jgi:hypothetical protein
MEPVLKTGGQRCLVGSNPTPSALQKFEKPSKSLGIRARGGATLPDQASLGPVEDYLVQVWPYPTLAPVVVKLTDGGREG